MLHFLLQTESKTETIEAVRVKGGMNLRNGMWHGLRNDIIMRNLIYGKWREEKNSTGKYARLCRVIFGANLSDQSIFWSIYYWY